MTEEKPKQPIPQLQAVQQPAKQGISIDPGNIDVLKIKLLERMAFNTTEILKELRALKKP